MKPSRIYEVPGGIVVEDERADEAYDDRQEQVDDEAEGIQQPKDS